MCIMAGDWFKLYRAIVDSRVFHSEGLLKVWVWCLSKASYRKRWVTIQVGIGTTEVELQPGQFIYGRASSAKELRMKPETVRTRMEKLKTMQNLTMQPTTNYTLVTICNWSSYQDAESEPHQAGHQPHTSQTPAGHHKQESKEGKEGSSRPKLRFSEEDFSTAQWMFSRVAALYPAGEQPKAPRFDAWASHVRLMRERDQRTDAAIRSLFEAVNRDPFWQNQILCPEKLRVQWDQLTLKVMGSKNGNNGSVRPATRARPRSGEPVRYRDGNAIVAAGAGEGATHA
jgi:hypothetical protein